MIIPINRNTSIGRKNGEYCAYRGIPRTAVLSWKRNQPNEFVNLILRAIDVNGSMGALQALRRGSNPLLSTQGNQFAFLKTLCYTINSCSES